jgi:hypothetical protein
MTHQFIAGSLADALSSYFDRRQTELSVRHQHPMALFFELQTALVELDITAGVRDCNYEYEPEGRLTAGIESNDKYLTEMFIASVVYRYFASTDYQLKQAQKLVRLREHMLEALDDSGLEYDTDVAFEVSCDGPVVTVRVATDYWEEAATLIRG